MKTAQNPCVRCGKERIVVKTWSEKIQTTMTQFSLALCPDKDCQKLVDAQNALFEEKRQMHLKKPKHQLWSTPKKKKSN